MTNSLRFWFFLAACLAWPAVEAGTYYVDYATADKWGGTGRADKPFASINQALMAVPDGSLVLVRPGVIRERVRLVGNFNQGVTVRSEQPYQASIQFDKMAISCFHTNRGCRGITLEGFEIRHEGTEARPLVIQIDGGGQDQVGHITLRDNIIHDSFNNDLLKINNGARHVLVEGNLFFNQGASDEHIDVNSAREVQIRNNIFTSAYLPERSDEVGRGSSYIVVKDSNAEEDGILGAAGIEISGNVFLSWQGSPGHNFILLGEDGKPYYEARDVLIENNLFIGDSSVPMRAPFGSKGAEQVQFRHNTVTGPLPSSAYAMRLNREGRNPVNRRFTFNGNIWSNETGSMRQFAEIPDGHGLAIHLDHNVIWNGDKAVPPDSLLSAATMKNAITANPALPPVNSPPALPLRALLAGDIRIRDLFVRLVERYGQPAADSPAVGGCPAADAPAKDILGNDRPPHHVSCGAIEAGAASQGALQP